MDMTDAKTVPRTAEIILKQLRDLGEVKKHAGKYGTPDFASRLASDSLRAHEQELVEELNEVLQRKAEAPSFAIEPERMLELNYGEDTVTDDNFVRTNVVATILGLTPDGLLSRWKRGGIDVSPYVETGRRPYFWRIKDIPRLVRQLHR